MVVAVAVWASGEAAGCAGPLLRTLRARGPVVSEHLSLSGCDRIHASTSFQVHVSAGQNASVTLRFNENLRKNLDVTVQSPAGSFVSGSFLPGQRHTRGGHHRTGPLAPRGRRRIECPTRARRRDRRTPPSTGHLARTSCQKDRYPAFLARYCHQREWCIAGEPHPPKQSGDARSVGSLRGRPHRQRDKPHGGRLRSLQSKPSRPIRPDALRRPLRGKLGCGRCLRHDLGRRLRLLSAAVPGEPDPHAPAGDTSLDDRASPAAGMAPLSHAGDGKEPSGTPNSFLLFDSGRATTGLPKRTS
ncbi:MAG: hypothetical protein JWM17_2361 [Actinobacteria bacterium]|nr:hypothetical protein [Actinomycetota bacterium]